MQYRVFVPAFVFPGRAVSKVFVITEGFAFFGLVGLRDLLHLWRQAV